jgi:hypothetical protein
MTNKNGYNCCQIDGGEKMKQVIFLVNLIILILLTGCQLQTATPEAETGQTAAQITGITVENENYVIDYEVSGFTECPETQDCMHIHLFFNTVPAEEAVVPGEGPWELYYGPSPFTGYQVADRPAGATQMCILVSNVDHTGNPDSATCVDLPE